MKRIAAALGKAADRLTRAVAEPGKNRGPGPAHDGNEHDGLEDLAGTWLDDPEFDKLIEEIQQVDPELWR